MRRTHTQVVSFFPAVRQPPQARGWALELCAGIDDDGYSFNTAAYLFTVNIVLTEAGLAAGPGFGLAPVALLFQYLQLLTKTGGWQTVASWAVGL